MVLLKFYMSFAQYSILALALAATKGFLGLRVTIVRRTEKLKDSQSY